MSCRWTQIELTCLVLGTCMVLSGCNNDKMQKMHQQNVEKWNQFWHRDDTGDSPGGHRAGEPEIWTIECNEYLGEHHREVADNVATALKKVEGIKAEAVRVEYGDDRSRVLYGSYPLKYVRAKVNKETQVAGDMVIELNEEIKRDLKLVRSLAMGEDYPFFSARPVPQPAVETGPAEWDLRNVQGVYTLNVGVTYNTPELHNHREAAIEWVKALREQGYEAYYYTPPGGTKTSICVGIFGEDALLIGPDGKTQYSEAVQTLRNQSDFQYNLENGLRIFRKVPNAETGQTERIPNWSFLVKIPEKEAE